ncbi:ParA family protein [Ureibacillus thermosphaericus]|uniref:Chromosome partitioning protein n=1 Tax=Ureibacillus thermosphaericus TaxID=51173 RepID=A0A840Q273_URETH|nr:ParA family protein [Ureibacillus thermosphaericus]MBB5150568.1 chromosome partitioning protein [Ureibacillus thermosphaericus]NKZ33161.1 ParA family protein [Ureibacillus thermosphaericus]
MKEPIIISFINMKGGVGKTTTTINIADTLVRHFKKNIMVVDMDPQFNATQALFTKYKSIQFYEHLRNEGKTIANIITNSKGSGVAQETKTFSHEELVIELYKNVDENKLYIIPGDLELIAYESSRRGSEKIISSYFRKNIFENYDLDYILIDTPATYSIYSQASLLASKYYIVPIAPDVFSTLGYSLLHKIMKQDLTLEDHDLVNLGIIFTLVKADKQRRIAILENFKNDPQFNTKIREYERIRTGKLETLMYDMDFCREEIVQLCKELIDKTT